MGTKRHENTKKRTRTSPTPPLRALLGIWLVTKSSNLLEFSRPPDVLGPVRAHDPSGSRAGIGGEGKHLRGVARELDCSMLRGKVGRRHADGVRSVREDIGVSPVVDSADDGGNCYGGPGGCAGW